MGDISTWDPVDNSNTTAPPDGWPEGMAPSAVNNSARAMMGAVRRWYDTVTAQLASLTSSLANYLPLTGGSLSGGLSATQYNINGVVFATGDGTTTNIYDGAGGTGLHLQAAINYYDADTHVFRNNAGSANGAVFDASGSLSLSTITATGNITASGNITGANLIGTEVFLGGHLALDGSTPGQLGMFTTSGDMAIALFGSPTYQNAYYNNTHAFENSGRDFSYAQFNIAGCFNVSGTWGTFSDASLKDDISPYDRGLDAILGLSPISFRYLAGTPFADPERTLRYGLMAQDVAGIIPEMVGETTLETGGTVGTVFPGHLLFVLVNAAKELAAQNAALAARIEALEATQQ